VTREIEYKERKSLKILLIEDEEMVQATFAAFLDRWGHEAVLAKNGREGLDIFAGQEIDLVLTDLDMPVMGGLEVLAYLHKTSPETPVIIISGAGQLNDAVQTVKLGAWDYLTKPIGSMAILENAIDRCMEKVHLIRENKRYQKHLEQEVREKTEALMKNNKALQLEIAERKQKQEELLLMYRHLEEIVDASGGLFSFLTYRDLFIGVLNRLHRLIRMEGIDEDCKELLEKMGSFAVMKQNGKRIVVCGSGPYKRCGGQLVDDVFGRTILKKLDTVYSSCRSIVTDDEFFGYVQSSEGIECVFYLDTISSGMTDGDKRLVQLYITNVASALDNLMLNEELINTQKELVITLGEVIETRSKESANHVRRVAEYSYVLARLSGMEELEARILRFAAPMHDAGKIGIPDSILNKPGRLTEEEFRLMEDHTVLGHEILKGSDRPILKAAAIVAREHHEKWNGRGYPRGLAGELIHPYGRIVALVDVFDALGSSRCYKKAWPLGDIVEHIQQERGEHFDPRLVDLMMENLDQFLEIKKLFPDG
jgi:response regulator RpfG family c-di-GMP phosphodiesterase